MAFKINNYLNLNSYYSNSNLHQHLTPILENEKVERIRGVAYNTFNNIQDYIHRHQIKPGNFDVKTIGMVSLLAMVVFVTWIVFSRFRPPPSDGNPPRDSTSRKNEDDITNNNRNSINKEPPDSLNRKPSSRNFNDT